MSANEPDRITIITPTFEAAAIEFHRSRMATRGYRLEGPIVARKFMITEDTERPQDMFEGKEMFAVSFVKQDSAQTDAPKAAVPETA